MLREQLKNTFPTFKLLLNSDFIDGECYTTQRQDFTTLQYRTKHIMNYTSIKNVKNMRRAMFKTNGLTESDKQVCKVLFEFLNSNSSELNDLNDIYFIVDDTSLLGLHKIDYKTDKHLIVYLTTKESQNGLLWSWFGRPIYKKLGWKIILPSDYWK